MEIASLSGTMIRQHFLRQTEKDWESQSGSQETNPTTAWLRANQSAPHATALTVAVMRFAAMPECKGSKSELPEPRCFLSSEMFAEEMGLGPCYSGLAWVQRAQWSWGSSQDLVVNGLQSEAPVSLGSSKDYCNTNSVEWENEKSLWYSNLLKNSHQLEWTSALLFDPASTNLVTFVLVYFQCSNSRDIIGKKKAGRN